LTSLHIVAKHHLKFIDDNKARSKYETEMTKLKPQLAPAGNQSPSARAAAVVKSILKI